jgi:RNA polymerase sigma factor (sigma-70 family)
MARGQLGRFLDTLRRVPGSPDDGAADGPLLERFASGNDGAAFAALLRRHGLLVWGVCRRTLGDGPDAEDAFQATFLVLARKARSVRRRDSVRSWLYGVASRVAVRARQARARRPGYERRARTPTPADPADSAAGAELRAVLDEEIARLPDRYRLPLVLCYLHGRTNDEAAEELGCPRGTVATRLARARERLRGRLLRRGVALSASGATLATPEVVPPSLFAATAEAVSAQAAGRAVAAPIATLTEGVLRAMYVAKLRTAAAVVVAVGILTAGAGAWGYAALAQPPAGTSSAAASLLAAAPVPAERTPERVKELMKERREAASEEFRARKAEFENGRGTLDQLLESAERLLKAELEMSTTRGARVEARKAHLEHLKEFLRVITERFKAGHTGVADFARSRYAALEAEIDLEREKAR